MMWCLIISNGVCIGDPVPYVNVQTGKGIEAIINEDKDVLIGMMKYFKTPSKRVPDEIALKIKEHVSNEEHHLARPLIEKHYGRSMCCDAVIEQFVSTL